MKGKRLDPTSGLHDTQDNRGREQKIDYVDDPIYSSLEKFMAFYYAKYGQNGGNDGEGGNSANGQAGAD